MGRYRSESLKWLQKTKNLVKNTDAYFRGNARVEIKKSYKLTYNHPQKATREKKVSIAGKKPKAWSFGTSPEGLVFTKG